MRRSALIAAVVGGLLSSSTFAAFTFTSTRTAATGAFAGFERVNLVVNSTTTNLSLGALQVDVTASGGTAPANALKFRVGISPDVAPPANFADTTVNGPFNPGVKGTFGGFSGELSPTSVTIPDPTNATNKALFQAGLPTVNFISFFVTPVALTTSDIPGGLVLASAVVPVGTTVAFSGTLDDDLTDTNGSSAILVTDGTPVNTPEPATLSAVAGAAAMGLIRRRK